MKRYKDFEAEQRIAFQNELFKILYQNPNIKSAGYYFVIDLIFWNSRANGFDEFDTIVLLKDLIFKDIIINHEK